jgi:hypothetical protein
MAFPATYNISYYQGDLYQFAIRPKTSAGDAYGITASTHDAFFYISTARGGSAGDTLTASAVVGTNLVTCTINPSVGGGLVAGTTYYYDVSIQNKTNANEIYTLLTGTINVTEDITTP